eukprot:NODE_6056_length_534_cov_79.313402_g5045_i1.p2 GENE.NODE_6056_length_534_cov_79.313402_g5045_i1~~NODE_6056_length_534_cov_79.313402_g5045_i1.p2  ORF type:complete len:56 (-),score=1.86 NODE_6056_length_534_cov_79.313402_g5045_i1:87-254(-)
MEDNSDFEVQLSEDNNGAMCAVFNLSWSKPGTFMLTATGRNLHNAVSEAITAEGF